MPLISRRCFPPNGWTWFQPQTQWPKTQAVFGGLTFDQVCVEIAKHRQANPRFNLTTDLDEIAEELDYFTCVRLSFDPNYCVGGPPGKAQAPLPTLPVVGHSQFRHPLQSARNVVAAGVDRVKKLTTGVGVLLSWIGSGGHPVPQADADRRAAICAECPKNEPGGWESVFTGPAAEAIRSQLSLKNEMDLKTLHDAKLNVCSACGCELKLKVWTPLSHVLKKLKPEAKSELAPQCWILHENQ